MIHRCDQRAKLCNNPGICQVGDQWYCAPCAGGDGIVLRSVPAQLPESGLKPHKATRAPEPGEETVYGRRRIKALEARVERYEKALKAIMRDNILWLGQAQRMAQDALKDEE